MTEKFNLSNYRYLQKLMLTRLLSFNARGGEVFNLNLETWKGVEDNRWKERIATIEPFNIYSSPKCYSILNGKTYCCKNKNIFFIILLLPIKFPPPSAIP